MVKEVEHAPQKKDDGLKKRRIQKNAACAVGERRGRKSNLNKTGTGGTSHTLNDAISKEHAVCPSARKARTKIFTSAAVSEVRSRCSMAHYQTPALIPLDERCPGQYSQFNRRSTGSETTSGTSPVWVRRSFGVTCRALGISPAHTKKVTMDLPYTHPEYRPTRTGAYRHTSRPHAWTPPLFVLTHT